MPELPDIEAYLCALRARVLGEQLQEVRIGNPFVLRTVEPRPQELVGREVRGLSRLGKRIAFTFAGEFHLVLHLMIVGRLQWKAPRAALPRGNGLLALNFADGCLVLTEAGRKRRAAVHVLRGAAALTEFNSGGLEVRGSTLQAFGEALTRENHTLKRALTDPRILSGIGNSYSDEILHHARFSPFKRTGDLSTGEIEQLHVSTEEVLTQWTNRLVAQAAEDFPAKVTAFRPEMAVHGKFDQPCPVCRTPVQRIVYAQNECNYCPTCQTGGKLLADRALSRLLKDSWPSDVEELALRTGRRKAP